MVEAVEVTEPQVEPALESYDDEFDSMWKDAETGPDLDAVPVPEEPEAQEVPEEPEPAQEAQPAEEPEVPEEPQPTQRPTVAARDPYAWIESLPEEQREMAEKLKHTALSDRGRVSALTRKLDETTSELTRVRSTQVAPTAEEVAAPNAQELPDSIKKLQEDYPELGKQLTEIFNDREAALKQEFSAQLEPIRNEMTADAQASEQARLEAEAAEIFKTDETGTYWKDVVRSDDFLAWLDMQPVLVQQAARTSNNVQDGLDVLRMYETDYQTQIAAQEAAKAAPSNDATETPTARGDALKAERQQRQATTVSPASRPVGVDTDEIAGDYDQQFNAMWGGKKK